jgi:hypothetical protein
MNILSSRKASQSNKSDVYEQKSAELTESTAIKNFLLMDTILSYLDENDPASPLYQSPLQTRNRIVKQWAASLPDFFTSPDDAVILENTACDNSPRRSTGSSAGSLLSDSSSYEESRGPKTPTCSSPTDLTMRRSLPSADVRLVDLPADATSMATSRADPKIRRKFSFELDPEPLSCIPDIPTNNITRGEIPTRGFAEDLNISSCSDPPHPKMQATITSLDDFLPDYIASLQITPTKKSTKPEHPELRIDTKGFHTLVNQSNPENFPELELSPPILPVLHVGKMISPQYTQQLLPPNRRSPGGEQNLRLITASERDPISMRHSIANPSPRKHLNYDEFRKGATRYSVQEPIPSKRSLNDLQENELYPVKEHEYERRPVSKFQGYQVHFAQEQVPSTVVIHEPVEQYSAPSILRPGHESSGQKMIPSILQVGHTATPRRSMDADMTPAPVVSSTASSLTKQRRSREQVEANLIPTSASTNSSQHSEVQIKSIPIPAVKHSRKSQAEIEVVPISTISAAKEPEPEPVSFGTNRGIWFIGGFFAKEQGLQLKMMRMVTTFSKMEWVIQDLAGNRQLKCFAPTNSLSRRKDFFDVNRNLLFGFQKRIGSTRVAESSCGVELFSVQNASLPCEFLRKFL